MRASTPTSPGVLTAASGFTSAWALSWLAAEALVVNTAVTGGFAMGGVMAGSGLTLLWWRTRTLRELRPESERAEAEAEHQPQAP